MLKMMVAVLMASIVTAEIDVLKGKKENPEMFTFEHQLSTDKTDIDYIPLGKSSTNQGIRVEFGISGNNAYHSASLNILTDWYNTNGDTPSDRVTVYLEDNMPTHTNQRDHLEVVYGPANSGYTYLYLKINPEYIANYCTSEKCKDFDHTVLVTIYGGQKWVSPDTKAGQDPAESNGVLPSKGYQSANIIRLGNFANADTFMVDFEDNDWNQDNYLPVGKYAHTNVMAFNVQVNGPGTAHNMHVELYTDYMQVRTDDPLGKHKDKMTAIISDSKRGGDQNQYMNFIYRQNPGTSDAYVYMKMDKAFITCGNSASCKEAKRSLQVQPTNAPRSFVPASEVGGVDPDFDVDEYLTAVKVEVAKELAGDSKWQVDLTDTKRDTDYVALGAVRLTEATSFKIGVVGWGTSHSLIIDVTTDWFNEAARGNAADSATVFVKDTKSHLKASFEHCVDEVCETRFGQHDPYAHWQIKYGHSDTRDMIWFYLQIDPDYYGCEYYAKRDDDPAIKTQCEEAAHKVQVHASGGVSYIAGNVEGGFDPNIATTSTEDKKYFTAVKIDVGAIPALEERLAAAETNLTAADDAIVGLQAANAEQGTTIEGLQTKNDKQDVLIGDLRQAMDSMSDGHGNTVGGMQAQIDGMQDQIDKLTAWMMAAPVPGNTDTPSACKGDDCIPNIDSLDGTSLALSASAGTVSFVSSGCKTTDLCELALDVEALKAKFDGN